MRAFIGIFVISLTVLSRAALAGPSPLSEAELAEKLRFYRGIRVLDVRFEQLKTLKDMDLVLKSEGELRIERPAHFIWKVIRPSPVSVSVDGEAMTIVSGAGPSARTQRLKLGDAPSDNTARSLASMAAWLNMDAKALHREYDAFAESALKYRFRPKKLAGSPVAELEMELTREGHLKSLLIRELSGDTLDIRFDKPRIAQSR